MPVQLAKIVISSGSMTKHLLFHVHMCLHERIQEGPPGLVLCSCTPHTVDGAATFVCKKRSPSRNLPNAFGALVMWTHMVAMGLTFLRRRVNAPSAAPTHRPSPPPPALKWKWGGQSGVTQRLGGMP